MLKFIVPFVMFVGLGVFLFVGLQRDPSYVPSPLIGKPAPEFSLPSLQDAAYPVSSKDCSASRGCSTSGARGAAVAGRSTTRCSRSRAEPVPIVGLNWKDDNALAQKWLRELGNPYAVVAEDREGRVAIDWGVYGAPETFLIGPDGSRAVQAHRTDDDGGLEHGVPAADRGGARRRGVEIVI